MSANAPQDGPDDQRRPRRRPAAWWDGLIPSQQKWIFGVAVLFALLALLPLHTPPFLDTPGHQLRRHHGRSSRWSRIIAIGLNVVVGQAGLARPRLRRLLRGGRVHRARCSPAPTARGTSWAPPGFFSTPWAWLSCVPLAMAVTALAGLILGIPTLRLRGDYLAIVTLGFGEIIRLLADNLADITNGPRGLNEVAYPAAGESEKLPERRVLQRKLVGPRQLRHLVVLAGAAC